MTGYDPTAGWQDLLSVLVVLVGLAAAALLAFAVAAWLGSEPVEPSDIGAELVESPSTP